MFHSGVIWWRLCRRQRGGYGANSQQRETAGPAGKAWPCKKLASWSQDELFPDQKQSAFGAMENVYTTSLQYSGLILARFMYFYNTRVHDGETQDYLVFFVHSWADLSLRTISDQIFMHATTLRADN